MFTDMVGFSALTQEDESRALSLLGIQTRLIEPILVVHQGQLVKTMGDGLLVQFDSASAACRAALGIQQAIREHNQTASKHDRFEVRIGVHLGDIEFTGDDVLGHGVNVASRIEPLAPVGGVCVSEDIKRQVEHISEFELKPNGREIT